MLRALGAALMLALFGAALPAQAERGDRADRGDRGRQSERWERREEPRDIDRGDRGRAERDRGRYRDDRGADQGRRPERMSPEERRRLREDVEAARDLYRERDRDGDRRVRR